MKGLNKRSAVIYICIFVAGILVGAQIPSLKSYFQNMKYDRQALKQIEEDPNDPNNLLLLATLKWRSGDHEASFKEIRKALEINPNYVIGIETMGFHYMELEQYGEAKKWLTLALEKARVHAPGEVEKLRFALATIPKEEP